MTQFDISGKSAVITGGAGVLCSTMSEELAKIGVKVAILDIAEDKAVSIAEKIVEEGGNAIGIGVDVLNKESLISAKDIVIKKFGRVDILINGAGGNKASATASPDVSFFDLPQDAMKWVFDLNLMGTILPTQVFGKVLSEQKSGNVINISSMAAYIPLTNTIAYSAAKAAISNFTQWMSVYFCLEYSPSIRVNAIAPGFLLTQQNKYLLEDESGNPTNRGKRIIDQTPMRRYGKPDELVGAVNFLCSDAASFITGVVLPIDGGFNAYSGV